MQFVTALFTGITKVRDFKPVEAWNLFSYLFRIFLNYHHEDLFYKVYILQPIGWINYEFPHLKCFVWWHPTANIFSIELYNGDKMIHAYGSFDILKIDTLRGDNPCSCKGLLEVFLIWMDFVKKKTYFLMHRNWSMFFYLNCLISEQSCL